MEVLFVERGYADVDGGDEESRKKDKSDVLLAIRNPQSKHWLDFSEGRERSSGRADELEALAKKLRSDWTTIVWGSTYFLKDGTEAEEVLSRYTRRQN